MQSIGAHLLDEHLAYLCSAEPVEHPLVACYEVLEEIPLQEKQLKQVGCVAGLLRRWTIKKRVAWMFRAVACAPAGFWVLGSLPAETEKATLTWVQ